jgi:UDP-N-acetylmuramyl tripeptide synthase
VKVLEQFNYYGFNRRSEKTALEYRVELSGEELAHLRDDGPALKDRVLAELSRSGIDEDAQKPLAGPFPGGARERFSFLLAGVALSLQRAAGHRVGFSMCAPDREPDRVGAVFEHESSEAGFEAGQLAFSLLAGLSPVLEMAGDRNWPSLDFHQSLPAFLETAGELVLPRSTQAIIDAARRRDIPVTKLDRDPYVGVKGDFRVCPNGMLMLGHASRKRVVDGTFPIDRPDLARLRNNRALVHHVIRRLGLPAPDEGDPAGERVAGETTQVLVAGFEVIDVITSGQPNLRGAHLSALSAAISAARGLNTGMLLMTVASPDIAAPLDESGGVIVDLDIAPVMDRIPGLPAASMDRAAEGFVGWLFPDAADARIPLVAITGTNGKTTTSRMINQVAIAAGYTTGMSGTTGVVIDGVDAKFEDMSGLTGHQRVLESDIVEFGVLETARGGITHTGFMYDHCDVAVCGNVTEDHLGEYGIETVDDMVAVKRRVLERATGTAIINIDHPACRQMLPIDHGPRLGLVSALLSPAEARRAANDEEAVFAGIENRDGKQVIVIDDCGERSELMAVSDIPATFDGRLRYNVYNALHAILASHEMGLPHEAIRGALARFDTGFDKLPGRMNMVEGLPYKVVFNMMTSPDAVRQFSEFMLELEVTGRRIILFTCYGNKSDEFNRDTILAALPFYDTWFLRDFDELFGREPGEVPARLESALLDAGVPASSIQVLEDGLKAVDQVLDFAREGDLVVIVEKSSEFVEFQKIIRRRLAAQATGP